MNPALHLPRVILVTRKTALQLLLETHGTLSQARYFLATRGENLDEYEQAHNRFESAMARVLGAIPPDQRRSKLDRGDLERFLFAADDLVVIVGQDGLVPNAAKYLRGQLAFGINPDPERYDGVLCPHPPEALASLLDWSQKRGGAAYRVQQRTLAAATRDDGVQLLALNEVFIGHQTHQSARYRLRADGKEERQSSSGILCSTGTGGTGWARSIWEQRALAGTPPRPEERRLAWFVREPFPSVWTGTALDFGLIEEQSRFEVVSEMGEGGVVFADGIEGDRLAFLDGQRVRVEIAKHALNLVVPASPLAR